MWIPDDVKARFIEAVDIERRVEVKGMSGCGNGWPQYKFDREDREGWDDTTEQDDLDRWKARKFTTSAEQSRWMEVVFEWRDLIQLDRRDLIWGFAECRARGWSFSKYCRDNGLVRMTAYRRVDRVLESLATHFNLEARLLKPVAERWVLQVSGAEGIEHDKVDRADAKRTTLLHHPFRTEKHVDTLTTPQACDGFAKHLASHNRAQARKREKALRGVPGEASAA